MSWEAVEYALGTGPARAQARVFRMLARAASWRRPRTGPPELMGVSVRPGHMVSLALDG